MKRFSIFIGAAIGFLMGEIFRRKKMERLAELEAKEAARKAINEEREREWQEELAQMPFQERMDYELWEAGMRLYDWNPPQEWLDSWHDYDDDDDEYPEP